MVKLSVVYGREIDGREVTFGTSGYTMKNTFVLYDRATGSVWYPTSSEHLEATSGTSRGTRIPFIAKPERMPLKRWKKLHPDTLVLIPG